MASTKCFGLLPLAAVAVLVTPTAAFAQATDIQRAFVSFNPGIRIGYTFGEGLTLGIDVSVHIHSWGRGNAPAAVFGGLSGGVDATIRGWRAPRYRVYGHVEGGLYFLGMAYGPAHIWGSDEATTDTFEYTVFAGVPLTATSDCRESFAGFAGTLYYRHTPREAVVGPNLAELGLLTKRFWTTLEDGPFCD